MKRVYIKSLTWNRDSFGLFDYESDNFSKNKLKTTGNAKIARIKNDIHLIQDNAQNTERINNLENSKLLGSIRKEESIKLKITLFTFFLFIAFGLF